MEDKKESDVKLVKASLKIAEALLEIQENMPNDQIHRVALGTIHGAMAEFCKMRSIYMNEGKFKENK